MLYFIDQNGNDYPWRVGESIPNIDIYAIQADGDELLFLKRLFPAYSWSTKEVQNIYGIVASDMYSELFKQRTQNEICNPPFRRTVFGHTYMDD